FRQLGLRFGSMMEHCCPAATFPFKELDSFKLKYFEGEGACVGNDGEEDDVGRLKFCSKVTE
ncbi:hypothetical protein K8089_16185, partial [Aequorivita sp. F47161]